MACGSTRVLLVEDDLADALLTKSALRHEDDSLYELIHVGWLEEALDKLSEGDINIVLLDLDLPDSTRSETIERILTAGPETPIVVLSGHADEEAAVAAVQAGAQDYLFKDELSSSRLRRSIRHAIERKQQELNLARQALYDELTALASRSLLFDRWSAAIARAKRNERWVGIVVVDLDRFKVINDTLGHITGDKVLCEVADRLLGSVRGNDTVARFGGDEFVILLEEVRGLVDAQSMVDKLNAVLDQPFTVDDQDVEVGASIGASVSSPVQMESIESVIDRADREMYHRKLAGAGASAHSSP